MNEELNKEAARILGREFYFDCTRFPDFDRVMLGDVPDTITVDRVRMTDGNLSLYSEDLRMDIDLGALRDDDRNRVIDMLKDAKAADLFIKYDTQVTTVMDSDGVSSSTKVMNSLLALNRLEQVDDAIVREVNDKPENYKPSVSQFFLTLSSMEEDVKPLFNEYLSKYKAVLEQESEKPTPEMDILRKLREEMKEEQNADLDMQPIMRQFYDMKEKYPDTLMLFRVGDFYETYERDAKNASEILGITLTWKNAAADFNTYKGAMAAFPFHALDTYLPKLIRAGQRCAICDQLEDPKLTKKQNKTIAEMVSPGIASQEKGIKEAPTAPKLNNQNNMAKKAKTVEQEKKDSPKENATQKTAATEQKVKEPETSKKETKAKEEKPAVKKAEAPAEKKETKAEENKQEAPKEKAKLSNGQTLDYASVFPMTHIDDKTYGLKAQVDGVQIGTKKLSDEERGMYFDKKVTPAQLVEAKFEKELKPEVFAQMKEWSQYKIPKEAGIKEVNTFKGKDDGKDLISMKTADDSWKTKALPKEDAAAIENKVATPKQVAAKNFSDEIAKEVKKHNAVTELKKNTLTDDLKADIDKIRIFPLKNDGESKQQKMGIQVLFKDGTTTKTKAMEPYDVSPVLGNSKKGIEPAVPRENAVAKYLMPELKAHAEKKLGQEQNQGPKR